MKKPLEILNIHNDFAGYVKLSDIVNKCIFICLVSVYRYTNIQNIRLSVSFVNQFKTLIH